MAWVFVAIAFGGFIPTYWLKLMDSSFGGKPILHIHGFLLFAWVLFYAVQVNFVASRKMADHRSWGIAGVSLFTALAISIVLAAINTIKQGEMTGFATQAAAFSIVTFSGIAIITIMILLLIKREVFILNYIYLFLYSLKSLFRYSSFTYSIGYFNGFTATQSSKTA
jgi:hypothetical protein